VHPLKFVKTRADIIPAIRTLAPIQREGLATQQDKLPTLEGNPYYGGMGAIDLLFRNQHPLVGEDERRQEFDKVQEFLREVTGNQTVVFEIPANKSTVIASIDGKRLPVSSLGTGIEELLVIATAATHFKKQVVCIEEPELHIHPLLQRKLIEFLDKRTDNTYFVATHSPHILDAAPASIYHVQL
jgi:hypothetical protein